MKISVTVEIGVDEREEDSFNDMVEKLEKLIGLTGFHGLRLTAALAFRAAYRHAHPEWEIGTLDEIKGKQHGELMAEMIALMERLAEKWWPDPSESQGEGG